MKGRVISRGKGDRPYPGMVRRIREGWSKNNLQEEEEEEEEMEEEEEEEMEEESELELDVIASASSI